MTRSQIVEALRTHTGPEVAKMSGRTLTAVYTAVRDGRTSSPHRLFTQEAKARIEREVRLGLRCPGPCWLLRDRPHICDFERKVTK